MAMMISKFHKLIQSKVVWYIILGVIVIALVGFFTPSMRSEAKRPAKKVAGELFGEKVFLPEYRRAYQNSYLWYILSSGSMPQITEEMDAALRREAWRRVVALRKAEMEKIRVDDREVVRRIQQIPAFRGETGAFDNRAYQAILKQLRLSSPQVEGVVREQIVLQKLMIRPAQASLISPAELRRTYHLYTDRFVLDYAVLPREEIEKEVSVSREEAKALFAENAEAFRMPSKVSVSYVEWVVADFVDQVELPEGAVLQAYDQNIERYRIETTNDVAIDEYKPFEEVEAEITEQLKENIARRLASEEATALVSQIAPKAEGDRPDFAGAATATGLTLKTLPAFGPTDTLVGIDEAAPFRPAAARLQDDAYSSFSDAVVGKHSVYVLSLDKRDPSFLPGFEVVEDRVMEAARQQAVAKALSARSAELQTALSASLAEGKGFKEALQPYSIDDIKTTQEFDINTELADDYADILVRLCLDKKAGELCQPVPMEAGILITYVAQRKSTDIDVGLPAIRQELVQNLSQNRARQLAEEWQDALLDEANFKNLLNEE